MRIECVKVTEDPGQENSDSFLSRGKKKDLTRVQYGQNKPGQNIIPTIQNQSVSTVIILEVQQTSFK